MRDCTRNREGGDNFADVMKMEFERVRSVDLREVTEAGGEKALAPVGVMREVADGVGRVVLELGKTEQGERRAVCADGLRVSIVTGGSVEGTWTLGGRITCAAAVPEGCVTVMTEGKGPVVLRETDGGWELEGNTLTEGPMITAESMANLSEPLNLTEFAPGYTSGGQGLSARHREMASGAMESAYRRMNARARACGGWLQPVMARARMRDGRGRTLYLSQPVIVGQPACVATTATISFDGDKSAVETASLSAQPYRLRVSCPGGIPEGATLSVEVSPQLHPFDPAGCSETRLTRLDTTHGTLEITLPGVKLDGDGCGAVRRAVAAVLMNGDTLFETIGEMRTGDTSELLESVRSVSVDAEIKQIAGAGCGERRQGPAGTEFPHRFCARKCGVSGDKVVWGDISPIRYEGPGLIEIAARNLAVPCSGSVAVTFNDRDGDGDHYTTVRTFAHRAFMPSGFSPLIVYPDGRATSIRIAVDRQWVKLPLTPTPDGRFAYYLAEGLEIVTLTQSATAAVVPAENRPAEKCEGGIIVASVSDPFVATGSTVILEGRVSGVTEAVRSRSTWDFGRHHFYLLTTSGIFSLAVGSGLSGLSVARISPLGSESGAAAVTGKGVMAIAGGRLVKVSGSAVESAADVDCQGVEMLAYDSARDELWLAGGGEAARVIDGQGRLWDRSVVPMWLYGSGGRVWLTDIAGTLRVTGCDEPEEEPSGLVKILWEGRMPTGGSRPRGIVWHLAAGAFGGILGLSGDGGTGSAGAEPLLTLRVNGQLNSPVGAVVVAPRRRNLTARLNGAVSFDTRFYGVKIETDKKR